VKAIKRDFSANRDVELARSDWKDGGFIIELPKTLDPNYLHPLTQDSIIWLSSGNIIQPTLAISNKNVGVGNIYFRGFDKNGINVAVFSRAKIIEADNNIRASFIYVDSSLIISGYTKIETPTQPLDGDASGWFESIVTYSVEFEIGWNLLFSSRYRRNRTYSTTPVCGVEWRGSVRSVVYKTN
jgi:hypothetical protein